MKAFLLKKDSLPTIREGIFCILCYSTFSIR